MRREPGLQRRASMFEHPEPGFLGLHASAAFGLFLGALKATRDDPSPRPSGPIATSISFTPLLVSMNSRIWLECAMPRDFRTYSARFRSPACSMLRNSSHVSISELMPTSVVPRR